MQVGWRGGTAGGLSSWDMIWRKGKGGGGVAIRRRQIPVRNPPPPKKKTFMLMRVVTRTHLGGGGLGGRRLGPPARRNRRRNHQVVRAATQAYHGGDRRRPCRGRTHTQTNTDHERVTARITQTMNTHQPSDQLVINDEKDITGWRSERVRENPADSEPVPHTG